MYRHRGDCAFRDPADVLHDPANLVGTCLHGKRKLLGHDVSAKGEGLAKQRASAYE